MTDFLRRWGPALLWTAVLFAASSRARLPVELHSGTDKIAHFTAYAVLGVLLAFGQTRSSISVLVVLITGSVIGALDELYQSTVPGRSAELGDWVADSFGAVFGVFCYHAWRRGRGRGRDTRQARGRSSQPLPHE